MFKFLRNERNTVAVSIAPPQGSLSDAASRRRPSTPFALPIGSAIRMGAVALALVPGWQVLEAQYPQGGGYQRQQASPADRTIEDLRQVAQRNAFTHGERERYDHAIEHLSEFSGKLYAGRLDRGKLDRGIDNLRTVLQRNRIDPRGREILGNDLNALLSYRASYAGYR